MMVVLLLCHFETAAARQTCMLDGRWKQQYIHENRPDSTTDAKPSLFASVIT